MMRQVYLYGALGRRFGYRHRLDVDTLPEAVWALSAIRPGFKEYFFRGPAYSFVKGATRRGGVDLDLAELPMTLGRHDIHIMPAAMGAGGGNTGKTVGKIILGTVMIAGAFIASPLVLGGAAAATTAGGSAAVSAVAGGMGTLASGGVAAGAFAAGSAALGASMGMGATAISLGALGAITYGNIASVGLMMTLTGVSQLLSPTPQASQAAYTNMERPEARTSFIYGGAVNTSEQGGPIPILYGRMRIGSTLVAASVSTDQIEGTVTAGAPGTTARQPFAGGEL